MAEWKANSQRLQYECFPLVYPHLDAAQAAQRGPVNVLKKKSTNLQDEPRPILLQPEATDVDPW